MPLSSLPSLRLCVCQLCPGRVVSRLLAEGCKVVVMSGQQRTTDVLEHSFLKNTEAQDGRDWDTQVHSARTIEAGRWEGLWDQAMRDGLCLCLCLRLRLCLCLCLCVCLALRDATRSNQAKF